MKKRMTTAFRELLNGDEIIVMPGVHDPLTARIAERLGFKALSLGGYAMGAHLATTEPLMGLEELVRICRYITAVINIPIRADAGAGFGEPIHVMRTVRELEAAGVAAVHIEDQAYPKRASYHRLVEHIISAEEMIDKIEAAKAARKDPDLVIVARTDAMLTEGYDEGVRRANLYLEAGADAAIVYPNTLEELKRAPKDIHGPTSHLNSEAHRAGRPRIPAAELQAMGYKMVSNGLSSIMAHAKATQEWMTTLKETGMSGLDQDEMKDTRQLIEEAIGLEEMYKIEQATVESR